MNELQAILDAYQETRMRHEDAVLATVISVAGSAYRRPGARMLITGSGKTVGTISGGCLERDVIERAHSMMSGITPSLVEYDTRGDEESVWGLGMGCNGVIRILLENVVATYPSMALEFIDRCLNTRTKGVAATIVSSKVQTNDLKAFNEVGLRFLFSEADLNEASEFIHGELVQNIYEDARLALHNRKSVTRGYQAEGVEVFFDVIQPARALVIFGAENDALPLVGLAQTLGWQVMVVDVRNRQATLARFSNADHVVLCSAEEAADHVELTEDTAVVVMTHNYFHDMELLKALLPTGVRYLGLLGPTKRTMKLLRDINEQGKGPTLSQLSRLHAPIGIDIGAETADEIALAITAEIKAIDSGRPAGFLRQRNAPIHDDDFILPGSLDASISLELRTSEEGTTFASAVL
jgi:xanthine dehydrogenase accessory factor